MTYVDQSQGAESTVILKLFVAWMFQKQFW